MLWFITFYSIYISVLALDYFLQIGVHSLKGEWDLKQIVWWSLPIFGGQIRQMFNKMNHPCLHQDSIFWSLQICYFFYKNITFGFTLFWFEAYASFSGQPAYNDWYMSCYNVFFTSLPVIALGVFDQDVSARLCLKVNNSLC